MDDTRIREQAKWAWSNMYGPEKAAIKLKAFDDLTCGGMGASEAAAALDDSDDSDWEGFCASRW